MTQANLNAVPSFTRFLCRLAKGQVIVVSRHEAAPNEPWQGDIAAWVAVPADQAKQIVNLAMADPEWADLVVRVMLLRNPEKFEEAISLATPTEYRHTLARWKHTHAGCYLSGGGIAFILHVSAVAKLMQQRLAQEVTEGERLLAKK